MIKRDTKPVVSSRLLVEEIVSRVDFNCLLGDVMAIADEVDSQLAQQMASYITESKKDGKEVAA